MIGTLFLFFKNKNILKFSISFASGVMISVSIFDLIPESIVYFDYKIYYSFFFIVLGMMLSAIIDRVVPIENGLYKLGIFSMIAIILHNIPEGMATFISSYSNLEVGILLAVAIMLHNIPEGISISIPIYYSSKSLKRAFLYTFIAALAEPIGGILAFVFLKPFISNTLMGILFSMIAGIMIHISVLQLLPHSLKYPNRGNTFVVFLIGFTFMYISHLLLS